MRAGLVGADGRTAMAAIALAGDDDAARAEAYERLRDRLAAPEPFDIHLAGLQPVHSELQERSERDIARAEMLAMPILLVLLVLIFGSLAAAALPVAIGGIAVVGSMLVLRAVTAVADVSPFALNVATILGLGLAIDYSLFVVSRFREELARSAARGEDTRPETIGLGLAFAVALDATVVRALLVPATMRLLGRASWWLPRPLARLHDRLGFDEGAEAPEVEPPAAVEREPELVGSRG